MPRVRHPLTTPDQRAVAKREPGRLGEASERDALDGRQDLACEPLAIDRLSGLLLPMGLFALAPPHRLGAPPAGGATMRRIAAAYSQPGERGRAGGGEACLLLSSRGGQALVAVEAFAACELAVVEIRPLGHLYELSLSAGRSLLALPLWGGSQRRDHARALASPLPRRDGPGTALWLPTFLLSCEAQSYAVSVSVRMEERGTPAP